MGIETMLAAAAIGSSAAAGGVGAFGALQGGAASKQAYEYKAAVAANNKIIADRNAEYAIAAGETEAQLSGMRTRAQVGETKAIQGSRGLDVNSGSAADVRESEGDIGRFNAMMIRSNAERSAQGYRVEGMNQESEGKMAKMAGTQAEKAGYIGAASSLLGAASSVSEKWYKFGNIGVKGYGGN